MDDFTEDEQVQRARILAVEDDRVIQEMLRFSLDEECDLDIRESAEDGLAAFELTPSDLVLMDIGLPGVDGYQACQELRLLSDVPVIFVSGRENLEDRLRAFDAGGNDFIVKPFDPPILLRKVQLALQQRKEKAQLNVEKDSLQRTAMSFLTDVAQSRVLLDFLRNSMDCEDYEALAKNLLATTADYGLDCQVCIRFPGGRAIATPSGRPSALEESVLEQTSTLGRVFRFRQRLVVNFDRVTLLVNALPEDPMDAGRIQDNLVILVEGADAIAETIGMRKESAQRAQTIQFASKEAYAAIEALRDAYQRQQGETQTLLRGLTDGVENTYYALGLSENQEERISNTVRGHAEEILKLFELSDEFDRQFAAILASLAPERSPGSPS